MARRGSHYDQAFEQYLRAKQIPYVRVDDARRALFGDEHNPSSRKSFDFVVYSSIGPNLLIDVKGRKHTGRSARSLDNWVRQADIDSLAQWETIFGDDFLGAFAFLYRCDAQPPDALFREVFQFGDRWYALLAIRLEDYRQHLKRRSGKWKTVNIPTRRFAELAAPLRDLL